MIKKVDDVKLLYGGLMLCANSCCTDSIREELLKKPISDFEVGTNTTLCELIKYYNDSHGFMASHVARAAQILAEMWADEKTTRLLAFTANLIATGLRGIIVQLIKEGFPHVIITTCGTIDHDIARSTGHHYYKGSFNTDDVMLKTLEIHRLGNVLIPLENYGPAVEKFTKNLINELKQEKKEWCPHEIIYRAGLKIRDENSILYNAAKNNIPVIVPGITDGAFGTQLVFYSRVEGVKIDIIGDEMKLADIIFSSEKLGALIIGGGISKHHTIWWAQFKEGLDYAIYITTAVEYDGSLSGAQPREAISWGKIKASSKQVVVYGDATVLLPLIVAGAKCIIEGKIEFD